MLPKKGLKRMVMVKKTEMTYSELHKEYIKKCQVNNLSEHTINFYNVNYRLFNKFMKLSELSCYVSCFVIRHLLQLWLEDMRTIRLLRVVIHAAGAL